MGESQHCSEQRNKGMIESNKLDDYVMIRVWVVACICIVCHYAFKKVISKFVAKTTINGNRDERNVENFVLFPHLLKIPSSCFASPSFPVLIFPSLSYFTILSLMKLHHLMLLLSLTLFDDQRHYDQSSCC